MSNNFYRITRCIAEEKGCQRLTEMRVAGYYTDVGKARITACCGKSIPYRAENQINAVSNAA